MHVALRSRAADRVSSGAARELLRVVALCVAYLPVEWVAMRGYALPAGSYEGPLIFAGMLRGLWPFSLASAADAALGAAWLGGLALLAARGRELLCAWSELDHGRDLRPLVMVCVGVSAWAFSTYDTNLYFGRGHGLDRALLVALVPLVWWRPVFLVPFVLEAVAVMGQFQHPLGGYHPTHVILPLRILFVGVAALGLHAVGLPVRCRDVVFVALLVVAAGYLRSGLDKLALGWLSYGNVHHVLFTTYASGWLGFLRPEEVSALGRWLAPLDPLLMLGTLGLELGVLFLFWSRGTAVALLVWGALFHLGVLALSGIFFWMWIAVDLALAGWLLSARGRRAGPVFSREAFLASLLLVPASVLWFRPVSLSWLDAPLTYTYRFHGVAPDGARHALPPAFFAPYEYGFTLGHFDAWNREPLLPIRWGAAPDLRTAEAISAARTPEALAELERRLGRVRYDPQQAAVYDRFLVRWIRGRRERGADPAWLDLLRAPPQLLSFAPPDSYRGREPLCAVEATRVTSWFDGEAYREIRAERVRSVPIPGTPGCDS